MRPAPKGAKTRGKYGQCGRKDRRSVTLRSGLPKKGGHGGKFTWSGDGLFLPIEIALEKEAVDVNDPNFEDPEPENVIG